ncbi:MAG TPA: hypothetical protein VMU75_12030 [Acidimicrobiales bacterium]|nr:hypothetical protein [Acidimicrobiales bacterium]
MLRGRFARRIVGALTLTLSAVVPTVALVSVAPATAAAGVGSDKSTISQLEQRIAREGALAQALVTRYDQVEGHLVAVQRHIARDRVALANDHRAQARAAVRLRSVAVDAYINAMSGSSTTFSGSANATTLPEREVYLGVAGGTLDTAATTLQVDQHRTTVTQIALRSEQAATTATLRQLTSARQAAQAATSADEATLGHVSASLLALVTAANARRQAAADVSAERALAATPQPVSTAAAPAPTSQPSPGGYANPLRSVSGLSPERIDQGVDYNGFGPLYAVGDGVVLSTVNGGWPGGTYITYRLTDGPAAGLVVYAAEDINPTVQVGENVTPNTVIGQMYEGPTGIETGWADGSLGDTMAAADGQFDGANSTGFGYNFSQLLVSLGAPGGIASNPPPGGLPAGWPQW